MDNTSIVNPIDNMHNSNIHYLMRGIRNNANYNYSYVHAVLQSLSCLDCAKQFVNIVDSNNQYNNNNQFQLTVEVSALFKRLNLGYEGYSPLIIKLVNDLYQNNKSRIISKNALSNDPYHFLFLLLDFLHLENNMAPNPSYDTSILYNQNLDKQKIDDYIYCLFISFFKQTQNSMICDFFFNVEKYTYKCTNCGFYYFYGIKKIFRIDVDTTLKYRNLAFPNRRNTKLTLDECFRAYIGGKEMNCKFCHQNNSTYLYTKICCSTRVLIIYLERRNHCFYGDVDIISHFNIADYFSISRTSGMRINPYYVLKACISYCNMGKYFADCYVNPYNCNNGAWYRFMDNQIRILDNVNEEINKYEPQMLIYELDEDYFNYIQQNGQNINQFNNNNQMNNNINQMNNNDDQMNNINQININDDQSNNNQINQFNQINQINNNNNNAIACSNPLLRNFSRIFEDQKLNQYRKMVDFKQLDQSIKKAQQQNQDFLKLMNFGYFPADLNNQQQNPFQQTNVNFQLTFSVVPENGDQSLDNNVKILAQVRSSDSVKIAIDKFFIKLVKPRESIKRFLLNGNILDQQNEQTLSSMNIDKDTIIKAIKSENFNELKLS